MSGLKKKEYKTNLVNLVNQWGEKLNTNINLFQSEDFDFKLQKEDNLKYTPYIPDKSIWKIIKSNT